jgi:hypothetical protein
VLKRTENVLLVRRVDDGAERHTIRQLDVERLIRLVRFFLALLHLKHSPTLPVQHEEVGNALQISRVILENQTARKQMFDLLDELRLEVAF